MARFSARTPANYSPNAVARAVAARREAGLPVFDATLSNPTQAGIFNAADDAEVLAGFEDARAAAYTPRPRGLPAAREAVADYYARRGARVDVERIFLTSSTSESYSWLFKLFCDPGDEVLTPVPSYPLFECLAALEGVRVATYPLRAEEKWTLDFEALEARMGERTRAVVAVHPNNPTGNYLRPEESVRLDELCARRGVALISDEVFWDFPLGDVRRAGPAVGWDGGAVRISLGGFSKLAGLPQMKFGWIAMAGPREVRRELEERLEWIADSYLPVSAPVQFAAARWWPGTIEARRGKIQARLEEGLDRLRPFLNPNLLPAAGWTAILDLPRQRSDEEWTLRFLDQYEVLVQPGFFYDFARESYVVASLLAAGEAGQFLSQALRSELSFPGRATDIADSV